MILQLFEALDSPISRGGRAVEEKKRQVKFIIQAVLNITDISCTVKNL